MIIIQAMGFVTDMKGCKREKHTRQTPYTQIQYAFWVFWCGPTQDKSPKMPGWSMDQKWIEWRQGHLHTSGVWEYWKEGRAMSIEW
jgi:hypothetical protein